MPQSQNLCIYTRKDDTQGHFENREHIIPACIGGMQKLPQGYVSDEANAQFSKLELKFAKSPLISTPRMFVGPGKRGSHNPKKKGGGSKIISVMKSQETGEYCLGYIRMGLPILIDKVHIKQMENQRRQLQIGFDSGSVTEESYAEKVQEWMECLANYDGHPIILREKELSEQEFILGREANRWYLAAAPGKTDEELNGEILGELSLINSFYEKVTSGKGSAEVQNNTSQEVSSAEAFINALGSIQKEKSQVTAHYCQEFDTDEYFRVIAKIAFNCLAEIRGRDYVLQEKFDAIREAILNGENIEELVSLMEHGENHLELLEKMGQAKGFGAWRHTILICRVPWGLVAEVMLYGSTSSVAVVLSHGDCRDFGELDGLVCDWEHKREMRLINYFGELLGHGENCL